MHYSNEIYANIKRGGGPMGLRPPLLSPPPYNSEPEPPTEFHRSYKVHKAN